MEVEIENTNSKEELIKKQLDFYFSDSNLAKDRFLKQKIIEDPEGYIDISIILSFNKMKKLDATAELIEKIVNNSSNLILNPDKTKMKRTTQLPENDDSINHTIYIENFDKDTTHESLRSLFEQIGEVSYVSLPRFEDRTIKGFAFIEFANENHAEEAIKKLNKFDEKKNPTGLRVISKIKWLEMKQKYKELLMKKKIDTRFAGKKLNKEKRFEGESCVVISNLKEELTRNNLKQFIEMIKPVTYIKYKNGTISALVYFKNDSDAGAVIEATDNLKPNLGENITIKIFEAPKIENKPQKQQKRTSKRESLEFTGKITQREKEKKIHAITKDKKAKHIKFNDNEDEKNTEESPKKEEGEGETLKVEETEKKIVHKKKKQKLQ